MSLQQPSSPKRLLDLPFVFQSSGPDLALSGSTLLKSRMSKVGFAFQVFVGSVGQNAMRSLVFKLRPKQCLPELGTLLRGGHSAILIDLSPCRHQSDEGLRAAILRLADRRWLHNDRHPNAVAEEAAWRKTAQDRVRSQLPQRQLAIAQPHYRDRMPPAAQTFAAGISNDEVGQKLFPHHWPRTSKASDTL